MKDKIAAMELSISTIVILVIAMSMLILGLVLVRTIFKTSTESVNIIDDKLKREMAKMFTDETAKIVVNLGSDKTAKIKADTEKFGVAFVARTLDGSTVDTKTFKYKLTLDDNARENCLSLLKLKTVESFFYQRLDTYLPFDEIQGDSAYAIVLISIPEGTSLCSQKVFIDVKDGDQSVGRGVFILEVVRKGIF
jgi:hypothetical protein